MRANRVFGTATAVAAIAVGVGLSATGCAASVSTGDSVAQSSAPERATGLRDMTTTLINNSGQSITTLQESLYRRQELTLPNGQQSAFDGGHTVVTGTINYPGGSNVTTYAANPAIGPVMAAIHVVPQTGAAGYTFDVGQTRTYKWKGHTFTIYRANNTDSSKEILITIHS